MIKQILVIGAAVSVFTLNGCSTARGFGQDLEDLGRIIQGQTAKNYQSHRSMKKVRAQKVDSTSVVTSSATSAPVVTSSVASGTTTYSYVEPAASTATEISQAPVVSYPYTPESTAVSRTPVH